MQSNFGVFGVERTESGVLGAVVVLLSLSAMLRFGSAAAGSEGVVVDVAVETDCQPCTSTAAVGCQYHATSLG